MLWLPRYQFLLPLYLFCLTLSLFIRFGGPSPCIFRSGCSSLSIALRPLFLLSILFWSPLCLLHPGSPLWPSVSLTVSFCPNLFLYFPLWLQLCLLGSGHPPASLLHPGQPSTCPLRLRRPSLCLFRFGNTFFSVYSVLISAKL